MSGNTFHSILCASKAEQRVRSIHEKFPFAILMWVGVESLSNAMLSFLSNVSIYLPLGSVLIDPHIGL